MFYTCCLTTKKPHRQHHLHALMMLRSACCTDDYPYVPTKPSLPNSKHMRAAACAFSCQSLFATNYDDTYTYNWHACEHASKQHAFKEARSMNQETDVVEPVALRQKMRPIFCAGSVAALVQSLKCYLRDKLHADEEHHSK